MKIIKRIALGLLVIVIIVTIVLLVFLNGTKPKITGDFTLKSGEISGKLIIKRDKWGVPQINAENKNDMFWGMGFVHASDRLFQMDLIRRLSTGRLSEIFGERALESDKEQKDLLIEEGIFKSLNNIKPDLQTILNSYCRGVNYYMTKFPLPPEFKLLGYSPEPWEIKDIMAIFKRMEVILAGSGSELYNMNVYAALGKERAEELLSGTNGSSIINIEEYINFRKHSTLAACYEREIENLEQYIGSNNWVISGEKTKSGKPILCNDPHLSNVFPSYFYQVGLKSGNYELSGNSIAGAPFVVIGRNANISWGFTNTGTDVIDYFILKTLSGNDDKYYLDGELKDFEVIEKRIKVKGEDDYVHKIKISKFGAVLKIGNKLLARHSVNDYPSTILDAIYGMNFSENIDEFIGALRKFSSPAQNVVFADSLGSIGYYPTGLVPKRSRGDGSLPLLGESVEDLWKGFYEEREKPYIINPKKGFMATANNRVIPENGVPLFAKNRFPSFRGDRIKELLENGNDLTVEDNIVFQTDTYLKSGEFLTNIVGQYKPISPDAIYVLNELKKWDKRTDSGVGPILFYRFEKILTGEIFSDEIKDKKLKHLVSKAWTYRLLDYPNGKYDPVRLNKWSDDKNTEKKEGFFDIVERSLILTRKNCSAKKNIKEDVWENVHTLTYRHPLGSVFPLKYFLNRGPYEMKGGKDCIMVSSFRSRKDFDIVHLSTFRMIIDMGNYSNSRMINSSGQSAHFMSRFYDDQIKSYVSGKYRFMENPPIKKMKMEFNPKEN